MKKWIAILLAVLLTAGCSAGPEPTDAPQTSQPPQEPTVLTTEAPTQTPTVPSTGEPSGTMHADILSNLDEGDFSEVLRFTVHEEGEQIALFADARVRDVVVEWGYPDPETMEFVPERELCRMDLLEPDTLIVVTAWLADVAPNLRIRYTGAAGACVQTVFQSGKDGSMLLYDEE